MRRFIAFISVVVAILASWSSPAAAHAELTETFPAAGAVLEESPARVEIVFTEAVEAAIAGIRLYNSDGERLDRGEPYHPDGDSHRLALDLDNLPDGAYVVTWRVVSGDAHPVHGAFTFRLGQGGDGVDTRALAAKLLAADGGQTSVGVAYAVQRVAVFASLLLLVGGIGFIALIWPGGLHDPRTRRILIGAWLVAFASTALGLGLQGAYGAGLGLGAIADPTVVSSVVGSRFGLASLARLGLLVCLALAALFANRGQDRVGGPAKVALLAIGVALLGTLSFSGHASTGRWVAAAIPVDMAHLFAVALWLGGLTLLMAVVLTRGERPDLQDVVPKFSRLALSAVIVIIATGAFQSMRQVGSFDALTGTIYGRLLAAKLVVFAAMVALAAVSRAWVGRHYAGARSDDAAPVDRLRKSVAAETACAAVVLILTALLVNAIPARTALALPLSTELEASDELLITVTIDPAKAGPLNLHLYTMSPDGLPLEVEEVSATLELAAQDIGPLEAPLDRAGPNHFAALGFDIPISGDWTLTVTARINDFDQETATVTVRIR